MPALFGVEDPELVEWESADATAAWELSIDELTLEVTEGVRREALTGEAGAGEAGSWASTGKAGATVGGGRLAGAADEKGAGTFSGTSGRAIFAGGASSPHEQSVPYRSCCSDL